MGVMTIRPLIPSTRVLEVMERALAASREGCHQSIASSSARPAPVTAGLSDDEFED